MADWCILRTSGPRTLKLAASLQTTGIDAWTPVVTARRVVHGRKDQRVEQPVALIPTFVFAPGASVVDLLQMLNSLRPPAVPFAMLKHRDRIPLISEQSLMPLRLAEEREQKRLAKRRHHNIARGARVQPTEGAWAGMTGVVESSTGKAAQVNFGSGFVVSIATYLLDSTVLRPAA